MRTTRFAMLLLALLAMLVMAACQPIQIPAEMMDGEAAAETTDGTTEEATMDDGAMGETMMDDSGAMATIATRSLRVRQDPSEDAEVIYGVSEGEEYRVLEISPDGGWVRLAIDEAPDGSGWVSAALISMMGELTGDDAVATEAPAAEATPAEAEEAEATAAPAEEPAAEATAAPAEELAPPAAGMVQVFTDGTRLRVRVEPNTEAEIVGYVYNGEEYEFVSQSEDGAWIQIGGSTADETDNPDGGWVSAEFLIVGQ